MEGEIFGPQRDDGETKLAVAHNREMVDSFLGMWMGEMYEVFLETLRPNQSKLGCLSPLPPGASSLQLCSAAEANPLQTGLRLVAHFNPEDVDANTDVMAVLREFGIRAVKKNLADDARLHFFDETLRGEVSLRAGLLAQGQQAFDQRTIRLPGLSQPVVPISRGLLNQRGGKPAR